MLALAVVIGVLCLLFLGVLVWRALEAERRQHEKAILDQTFPKKEPK